MRKGSFVYEGSPAGLRRVLVLLIRLPSGAGFDLDSWGCVFGRDGGTKEWSFESPSSIFIVDEMWRTL